MSEYVKNEDELGGLWIKTGQRGEYMTGTIDGKKVVCFRVDKKNERQPDWRVLKSKPKDITPTEDSIPF